LTVFIVIIEGGADMKKISVYPYNDITGKKFGRLTAIKPIRKGGRNRGIVWLWRCDCGNEIERVSSDIKRGHQLSCGCLKIDILRKRTMKSDGEAAFNTLLYSYKNGAKHRGLKFSISKNKFKELTKGNCYYCGNPPSTVFFRKSMNGSYIYNGVDRIDNNIGYVYGNVVSCCERCNMSKLKKTEEEFLKMVKEIYLHRFLNESRK